MAPQKEKGRLEFIQNTREKKERNQQTNRWASPSTELKQHKKTETPFSKATKPIVRALHKKKLEELPDREFLKIIIIIFNQPKDGMNAFPESKCKGLDEIRKSIQDMKVEFNREIELLQEKTKLKLCRK